MPRFTACFSALLLSCSVAFTQTPAPARPPWAAGSQPGVTTTQSPEINQFQKIEDSWSPALNAHDQYGLELVLSPLFVDVAASGDITTRNQQLANVITGEDKTLQIKQKVITVRMLGDIAVANGTYTMHHHVNSAKWMRRACLRTFSSGFAGDGSASIRSALPCAMTQANAKKKSSAEPFHFPLFSRGDKGPQ